MSQPFSRFAGDTLYLDTTAFYLLLRAISPEAHTLFSNLEQGRYRAFTSVLTFDELAYRLLLAAIGDRYGGSALDHLRKDERRMVAEFYPQIGPRLERVQSHPNLALVSLAADDLAAMHRNILQFQLRPRDALHLAAMQKAGCLDIVSQDPDFDAVPDVRRYTLG